MTASADERRRRGSVITFYSYKGGSGRTQALANIAFLLAAQGYAVCAIDWDLEAPGMHRYFHPFLADPHLKLTSGLMDYLWDLSAIALTPTSKEPDDSELDIRDYLVSVDWDFDEPGRLDILPAGRQDDDYPRKAMSFQWEAFYERMGGGKALEAARETLVSEYDYVLIDSRTGVSDTSGICTIQLPDRLVACYTLNRQSIDGVANVLDVVRDRRRDRHLQIFPLEMRVETSEKHKLEAARRVARPRFEKYLEVPARSYWEDMEIGYWPFYAFEECLAVFGDDPQTRSRSSMINAMERTAAQVAGLPSVTSPLIDDSQREEVLRAYALGDYAPGAAGEVPATTQPAPASAKAELLWAEAAARHQEWEDRRYEGRPLRGPGLLGEGRYLLPGYLLYELEAQRSAMPKPLQRNPIFLLWFGKSHDWARKRFLVLSGAAAWLGLVIAGAVIASLPKLNYTVTVGILVLGLGIAASALFGLPVPVRLKRSDPDQQSHKSAA
jgi:MinD-like ATPase involved in chromosome partitioning or flagellar assembly